MPSRASGVTLWEHLSANVVSGVGNTSVPISVMLTPMSGPMRRPALNIGTDIGLELGDIGPDPMFADVHIGLTDVASKTCIQEPLSSGKRFF